jgi:prepilin-type N-terminal cleavage/methylation domain-containing protein
MQTEQYQTKYLQFKMNKKQKGAKGFTLVEIAIVLVIVGLLVAGILKGQELITSARVRNIIQQKDAVQAAYFAFLDRYKVLPGDLTTAQVTALLPAATAATQGNTSLIEPADFATAFQNLGAAGFLSTTAAPVNPFGGTLALYHAAGDTTGPNFLLAVASTATQLILNTGGGISSSMLAEIDRKADDGVTTTGGFRFTTYSVSAGAVGANSGILTNCTSGTSAWAVNPPNASCAGAWLF